MNEAMVVLTGAPNSGKTTTLGLLESSGYRVVPEVATEVIGEGKLHPLIDATTFRKEVLARQVERELRIPRSSEPVFLDRGAHDAIGYCLATGVVIPDFLRAVPGERYQLVFVLEEVPFWQDDGIRYEDLNFARMLTPVLADVYRQTGTPVFRVPLMPVADRVLFILQVVRRYMRRAVWH